MSAMHAHLVVVGRDDDEEEEEEEEEHMALYIGIKIH